MKTWLILTLLTPVLFFIVAYSIIVALYFGPKKHAFKAKCFYLPGYYKRLPTQKVPECIQKNVFASADRIISMICGPEIGQRIVECKTHLPKWTVRIYYDKDDETAQLIPAITGLQLIEVTADLECRKRQNGKNYKTSKAVTTSNVAKIKQHLTRNRTPWNLLALCEKDASCIVHDSGVPVCARLAKHIDTWYESRAMFAYFRFTGSAANNIASKLTQAPWPVGHFSTWGKSENEVLPVPKCMDREGCEDVFFYYCFMKEALAKGLMTFGKDNSRKLKLLPRVYVPKGNREITVSNV